MPPRRPSKFKFPYGGSPIEALQRPPDGAKLLDVRFIREIERYDFELCPICLVLPATEEEDVPPRAIGGRVMTKTCKPCNNVLGTRLEDEVTGWFDGALVQVRFASDGLPGARKAPRLFLRTTSNGDFVLAAFKDVSSDVRTMLEDGTFDIHFAPPHPDRYLLGLLKHAYLGACLLLRDVPRGPIADAIRQDLLAARDAPDRNALPPSAMARDVLIGRAYDPQPVPPLALVGIAKPGGVHLLGIVLARTVVVAWPLGDDDTLAALGRLLS